MKAIVQDTYGPADVLELREIERPEVGENDVLVRVRAAGSGPDVWHIMTVQPYMARAALGFRRPKVRVRGGDVAGTGEAGGVSGTGFRPGHGVSASRTVEGVRGGAEGRSFAEYAVTSPDKLVPNPANLSFEQAAALPI